MRKVRKKEKQYKEITEKLERNGFKWKLHIIVMGVRGWMPNHTWEAMSGAGLANKTRKILEQKLSELAVVQLHAIWLARRGAEVRRNKKGTLLCESGFIRHKKDKNEKKFEEKVGNKQRQKEARNAQRFPKTGIG